MYLTTTRPHILYHLSVLSRFLNSSSELHIQAAKRVLRYITGPMDYDMKSTSGYGFIFGAGYLSCSSKKQEIVAQSIAAAEFIASTAPGNQALWIKKILCGL